MARSAAVSVTDAESNSLPSAVVLSDEGYTLLHEVRLRGLIEIDEGSGRALIVTELVEAGLVAPVRTSIRITSSGRELHERWARVPAGGEIEAALTRGYERFLPLNVEFLRLCHDWQVRPGNVPNQHDDEQYDWSVIDRLRTLDERTAPVLRGIARSLQRFDEYPGRLRRAFQRVDEGDTEWFTSPRVDSYHTVWMHVHEDLLLALGLERGDER
jgi:hypothetical protein